MHLWIQNLIGILVGVLLGTTLAQFSFFFKNAGTLFIDLLKMIASPLVFCLLVIAANEINAYKHLKFQILKASTLLIGITLFIVLLSIIISLSLLPQISTYVAIDVTYQNKPNMPFIQLLPTNFILPFIQHNMQQIVILALFVGYTISKLSHYSKELITTFKYATSLFSEMMNIIIKLTPYGISMLTATIFSSHATLHQIYIVRDLLIILLILFVLQYLLFAPILGLILKTFPLPFYKKSLEYQIMAFSTGSSKAVLPITMKIAQEKLGISSKYAQLFLPLASSLNMIGLAIYIVTIVLFIAQLHNITFDIKAYIILISIAIFIPIGTAGIPSGALSILPIVLSTLNLPMDEMFILIAIDPIINLFRTTLNITGDVVIVLLLDKLNHSFNYNIYQESINEKIIHNS
ncbi:Proton glutamate symport protein [Rickettsiales bacterium Ac37b]|nr:Proton glutamate symport protein [Rickettsiales bacterium Ac37b]